MNNGAFGENFPYSNFHDLNMDWIIKIAKDFLDQYTHIQETITDGEQALQTEADNLEALLQQWYDTHSEDIAEQLADALNTAITNFNQSADQKAQQTIASIPADYTALSHDVNDLENAFNIGTNLFNKNTAISGSLINLEGNVVANSLFYCSDFISVKPSSNYQIKRGVGSAAAFLTTAFYDSDKTFIGKSFNSTNDAYTVTTPANCHYIRVNGAVANINDQMVVDLSGFGGSYLEPTDYQLILNGKNTLGVSLISAGEIFYDRAVGSLRASDNIYLITPDNRYNLGRTIQIGTTGSYLKWNKINNTIELNNDFPDDDHYLLAIVSITRAFEPHKQYCTIDSAFPIFTVDFVKNELQINVKATACYLIYNACFYSIPQNYTQTLTLPTHGVVGYDPVDGVFKVFNDFIQLDNCIQVMTRYYRNISCRVPYETVIYNDSYKRFACYGDSLTWYNGNAFTWGPHQGETCIGYEEYLTNELNLAQVANRGVSGETTPEICTRIRNDNASEFTAFDVVTIMGGSNDDRRGYTIGTLQPVGSSFNTATIIGALQSAVESILTRKSTIRVILMTDPMGWTYRNDSLVRVSPEIPNAYKQVAEYYGLPFIDLYSESGINEKNRNTYYADPADTENQYYMYHPNNDGWVRLSKLIVKKIKLYT